MLATIRPPPESCQRLTVKSGVWRVGAPRRNRAEQMFSAYACEVRLLTEPQKKIPPSPFSEYSILGCSGSIPGPRSDPMLRFHTGLFEEVRMFDSLADRIRQDDRQAVNKTERYLRWALVAVVSVVLFGGLYIGVRFLEY